MKQIQSGNLVIRAEEERLVFEISGPGQATTTEVPIEDLPLICEFLRAHNDARNNRRRGYRLDLDQLRPEERRQLMVTVTTDAGAFPVNPADLSVTGIRVQSDIFNGTPGTQATVTLSFEDKDVTLPAVLVRRYDNDNRFAFHFPEIFGEDGRLKPPAALTDILYALESLWLDKNLDLKWNLA